VTGHKSIHSKSLISGLSIDSNRRIRDCNLTASRGSGRERGGNERGGNEMKEQ